MMKRRIDGFVMLLVLAGTALGLNGCWWVLVGGTGAEAGYVAGQKDRSTGEVMSDQWIHTKVKAELLATEGVPSNAISVSVHKGLVRLKGVVPTAKAKSDAIAAARAVKGVRDVVDKLFVSK